MKRLLITGAAGALGRATRERCGDLAKIIRVADRTDPGPLGLNEEPFICDLADRDAVFKMVQDCDGIVHFGGQPIEAPWSIVRDSNIEGMHNLYEAARANGHPRILFASSNHAVGFYKQTEKIDATALPRPDSFYGVSKVFGEALASMYYDKFGQETAIVRIGACFPEPKNHRYLSMWLSFDDLAGLVRQVFSVDHLGCPIIYGVSDNDTAFWDNSQTAHLGWTPKDNSEVFRAKVDAQAVRPAPDAPEAVYHGGPFTDGPIQEE